LSFKLTISKTKQWGYFLRDKSQKERNKERKNHYNKERERDIFEGVVLVFNIKPFFNPGMCRQS